MKILKPEFERKDKRGRLIQIVTGDFKQLNFLEIKKGHKFGGHYHKKKREIFYVIKGEIQLETITEKGVEIITLFKEGSCFLVEPYDKHIIVAEEDSLLVEVLSEPYSKNDTYE